MVTSGVAHHLCQPWLPLQVSSPAFRRASFLGFCQESGQKYHALFGIELNCEVTPIPACVKKKINIFGPRFAASSLARILYLELNSVASARQFTVRVRNRSA